MQKRVGEDVNDRQVQLLKLIVEDYIKTAHPISSKSLCDILDCSSATIRNEMGILEDLGYIEKTHTSSGRIPSEQGYRYYVDHMMNPTLLQPDLEQLDRVFHQNSLVLTDVIEQSMELVSELTQYTSVVLGNSARDNKISKIEAIPLSEQRLVTLIITDRGHVEHKEVIMPNRVSLEEVKQTVELINRLIIGTPIDEVPNKLEYEVKPIIGKYVKQHEMLYNAFYHVFEDFTKETNVKFAGTSHILAQPEFRDVDKIQELIRKFDDKEIVNRIKESKEGVQIYIGSENEFDENVSVITTKYRYHGEEGTIALIGPKRMDYDRVIALLDYISNNME